MTITKTGLISGSPQSLNALVDKINTEVSGFLSNLVTTGKRVKSVTAISGAGAIPLTHEIVKLTTTGANALTLADGTDGQELTIIMITDGGDGTLTPAHFGNGSTITFNDAGDSVTVIFTNSKWYIKSNNGATVA